MLSESETLTVITGRLSIGLECVTLRIDYSEFLSSADHIYHVD